uniref:Pseudouridine synthase I TruA alpha/beta domain-containing protein n=1 Tax=Ditylenchus dipsaci TaxID=166011 RepID=A0A915CYC1_9BILA
MALDAKARIKFVRHALLLAYEGSNYYGMQYQGDKFPSIHETEDDYGDRRRLDISYASRTDKSVSATGQIVSAILPLYEDLTRTGVDTINRCLPDTIRVLGICRAPKSFNAKIWCDARTYCYVVPTYAFASCDELTDSDYRISEQRMKEVSQVLSVYEGFHNFFNYTSGKKYTEESVKRHIYSFGFADAPYLYYDEAHNVDVEFITIRVKGQSFMLHQIRKMIGTTIWLMRNLMSKADLWKSFRTKEWTFLKHQVWVSFWTSSTSIIWRKVWQDTFLSE